MPLKYIKILSGPLIACLIWLFYDPVPEKHAVAQMTGTVAWIALWWLTEALPLAVTALLPLIIFPVMGIMDSKDVAAEYIDSVIFLFIGGFILSYAIERWNLHKRIALKTLIVFGTNPRKVLFGIMFTSFILSMWISNTATVMMLLAAVLALILQIEKQIKDKTSSNNISKALLIGLAYAASIGGMATLVGTPTNMIFYREYLNRFPDNNEINFFSWIILALPVSLLLLLITYKTLCILFINKKYNVSLDKKNFDDAYQKLGKLCYEEKMVLSIFVLTALLWFTRGDIEFGNFTFYGWSNLFSKSKYISDSTVAILSSILLFIIPSKKEKGASLISWEDVKKLPFDIILLFGGGFALAKGFDVSGLSNYMAGKLTFGSEINIYAAVLMLCILVTLISEFASNVACIQLMLPVLMVLYQKLNLHPLYLMLPATLASSLGFMLPVATAPNTIVFGSGHIKVKDMLKAGFWVDIAGILLITASLYYLQLFIIQ